MNNAAFSLARRRLSGATGEPVLRVISLGAGVQSSTLLLMALRGEFDDAPDCAIFADTQWESKATYRHLEFLEREAARFDFPIFRVTAGDIRRSEWNKMPLFCFIKWSRNRQTIIAKHFTSRISLHIR